MTVKLGFIGFGEGAYAFALGFRDEKADVELTAYDVLASDPEKGARIRERAEETGVTLVDSPADLAAASTVILSLVVSSVAERVAQDIAPHLTADHFYADMNSASPMVKQAVQKIVEGAGAGFAEAAVMAAIPPNRHKSPLLLAGASAQAFEDAVKPIGMVTEVMGTEVGQASATKMFRSIIMKGIEALLLECLVAAGRYGVDAKVLESVNSSIPGLDWRKQADYFAGRTAVHGVRRAHEMEEVAETLESMGIDPIMAAAAAKRIAWGGNQGLAEAFGGNVPDSYKDVLAAIAAKEQG